MCTSSLRLQNAQTIRFDTMQCIVPFLEQLLLKYRKGFSATELVTVAALCGNLLALISCCRGLPVVYVFLLFVRVLKHIVGLCH
jgi:hypothetical protein